jgi:hypothetical protein
MLVAAGLLARTALRQTPIPKPNGAPQVLVVVVTSSSVGLSWAPVAGATTYVAVLPPVQVETHGAPQYTFTHLAAATKYEFLVVPYSGAPRDDMANAGPAGRVTVTTLAAREMEPRAPDKKRLRRP